MMEEQQQQLQEEQDSSAETRKLLHDAAYISGGESTRKIQPPSRSSSGATTSLDFKIKSGTAGGTQGLSQEKPVTTKPGKRKIQPPQVIQEEQEQHHKHDQKVSRPLLQSRARGSGGPPPRKYSLEDLDRMSEEQIFRVLSEDPDLHAAAMKAAGKGNWGSRSGDKPRRRTTSAPTGSKKSRRSPPKRVQEEMAEKEVPYFQWIVLIVLVGLGIFQLYKSHARSGRKKSHALSSSNPGAKVKGGKPKKLKMKKAEKTAPKELLAAGLTAQKPEDHSFVSTLTNGNSGKNGKTSASVSAISDSKKPSNKKKKKPKQTSSDTDTKKGKPTEEHPIPVSMDESLLGEEKFNDQPAASIDDHESMNLVASKKSVSVDDEEAWQSVTKSKAGSTKGLEAALRQEDVATNMNVSEPVKPDVETKKQLEVKEKPVDDGIDSNKLKKNGQKASPSNAIADSKTATKSVGENETSPHTTSNNNQSLSETKRSAKKNKKKQKPITAPFEPPATVSTDDDEALALQLQKEEENIATVATQVEDVNNFEWEEVATKKKKGGTKG